MIGLGEYLSCLKRSRRSRRSHPPPPPPHRHKLQLGKGRPREAFWQLTQPPCAWIQGPKLCTCSTLSPARVPPSRATRRLSSMARARRARGSGEGGGGPGQGKVGRGRLARGLSSRLENSSTRRAKEPAERRASFLRRAGSEASCEVGREEAGSASPTPP